ncbi:MAG TPA: hypothetical protein VKA36_03840 [Solirubrobacterales bacterium]|nr:hypothetical protein [Solirubrobacterales bacterium]
MRATLRSDHGQATVEYVGALLLVAALLAAGAAIGGLAAPAARLASTVTDAVLCAVRLSGSCGLEREALAAAYDPEIAGLIRRHAPEIRFEDGEYVSLPVDPRSCRDRRCADTSARGSLERSWEGEPPTAFLRVADCRAGVAAEGVDCGGDRAGNLYLQYWLYYPDSATRALRRLGYHRDDWESLQLRIGPSGAVEARASSHHGYNHGPDKTSDLGAVEIGPIAVDGRRPAWGPANGYLWVSEGSHAGRAARGDHFFRSINPGDLQLIPLETELGSLGELGFEVAPPWRKPVWTDPEHVGT